MHTTSLIGIFLLQSEYKYNEFRFAILLINYINNNRAQDHTYPHDKYDNYTVNKLYFAVSFIQILE